MESARNAVLRAGWGRLSGAARGPQPAKAELRAAPGRHSFRKAGVGRGVASSKRVGVTDLAATRAAVQAPVLDWPGWS